MDAERFDKIDKEFKQMTEELARTLNVVEATNKDGLASSLDILQKELVLCEKALAEYLETKRLAFPRFYFVSSSDLLDILSNGNQPEVVAKHLTKLFDSMARLKFDDAAAPSPRRVSGESIRTKSCREEIKLLSRKFFPYFSREFYFLFFFFYV